jgi:hypothetical protein
MEWSAPVPWMASMCQSGSVALPRPNMERCSTLEWRAELEPAAAFGPPGRSSAHFPQYSRTFEASPYDFRWQLPIFIPDKIYIKTGMALVCDLGSRRFVTAETMSESLTRAHSGRLNPEI